MNAPVRGASARPIAVLFSEHGDFVFRTLQYLGVAAAALDDALQDVFITAHRRWDTFEGRSSPRTWLYGIARRVAFRYRRKHRNRHARFVLTEVPSEGVDQPFERAHARRSVTALLEELDDAKRAAFVLVEVEGFTAAEAAALLDVPLGTVYSRVRAAWARLRDAAQDDVAALRVPMPQERRTSVQRMVLAGCVPAAASGLGVGSVVLGVALAGVAAAGVAVWRRTPPPPVSSPPASRPSLEVQPVASPAPVAVPEPRPPVVTPTAAPPVEVAKPRPKAKPRPAPANTLREELEVIRRAKALQAGGKPTEATKALDDHARRFPSGQLSDEREELRQSIAEAESQRVSEIP